MPEKEKRCLVFKDAGDGCHRLLCGRVHRLIKSFLNYLDELREAHFTQKLIDHSRITVRLHTQEANTSTERLKSIN